MTGRITSERWPDEPEYAAQAVFQDNDDSVSIAAPILAAILTRNIDMVRLLIQRGVYLNKEFNGVTRLHGNLQVLLEKQTAQDFLILLQTELRKDPKGVSSEYTDIAKLISAN